MAALTKIELPGMTPDYSGKVRDIYFLADRAGEGPGAPGEKMVMIASDRISAFDVVFREGIEDRGKILTRISNRWFSLLQNTVRNHLIETDIRKLPQPFCNLPELDGRTVLARKLKRVDFECIVRGYLMGSGYQEYQKSGEVVGNRLPPGLTLGSRLEEPIFTPSTKADEGHDINVSYDFMANEIGEELAARLREISLKIFNVASRLLAGQGIILADTKLEFGLDNEGLVLIDEVLTPDSSRYWKEEEYRDAIKNGKPLPSMDKQIIRDYLQTLTWNKQPPPPALPDEILQKAKQRYEEIEKAILCISPEE